MGLAYPGLTSVYNGTNPDKDATNTSAPYNPFFFTAVSEGAVSEPCKYSGEYPPCFWLTFFSDFSVALNRGSFKEMENSTYDPNLGYLAFGGIAPVATTNTAVTVPVQGTTFNGGSTTGYFFYTVDIDSYVFAGASKLTGYGKQAILDTGTTLNYVPTALAKEYNSKFVPPAKFVEDEDTYYVECDAKVPSFEVEIGGTKFSVDAKDQILPNGFDSSGKVVCISGTQDGGDPSDPETVYIMCALSPLYSSLELTSDAGEMYSSTTLW